MADFFWCLQAAQRGWSIEETANKLTEVSARAQERTRLHDDGAHHRAKCLGGPRRAADRRAGVEESDDQFADVLWHNARALPKRV